MNEFINIGIDLGTTNSCIAEWTGEEVEVYMNNEQSYSTPSIVYINPNGRKMVGTRAKRSMLSDPENVQKEFKRKMGNDIELLFPGSNIKMSPEELSAEILKSLVNDANRRRNSEQLKSAVITVPASFNTSQCKATEEAGKLAGINNIYLLQEPIAVSMAYGVKPGNKNKNFLVYDLGGGTLDIALISTQNNKLSVIDHIGDNFTGGKDIDNKIVEEILFPYLNKHYKMPPLDTKKMNEKYNILLNIAERLKVELSNSKKTDVDFFDLGNDLNGELFDETLEITREQIEQLLNDVVNLSLEKLTAILNKNNISSEKVDKILMVGGSTQIPYLKNQISENLNIKMDSSLNPVTVVAKGASIYASMIKVNSNESAFETLESSPAVDLEYNNMTSNKKEMVLGKFDKRWRDKISEVNIIDQSGIWESGWISLEDDYYFEVEVLLQENITNEFQIKARNKTGVNIDITNNIFSIRHNDNTLEFDNEPLPHSIFVEVLLDDDQTKLIELFSKNTPLPIEITKKFKAAKNLHPTDINNQINIKLWEGEEYNYTAANILLGNMKIMPKDLVSPIREDDEIELRANIDRSRRITVVANIIKNDRNIVRQLNRFKNEKRNINEIIEEAKKLLDMCYTLMHENENKIYNLEEKYQLKFEYLNQEIYKKEEKIEESKNKDYSVDKILKLHDDIKKLYNQVIRFFEEISFENDIEIDKLNAECNKILNETKKIVEIYGDKEHKEKLDRIKIRINQMNDFFIQENSDKTIKKSILRNINNLKSLKLKVLTSKYDFWENQFKYIKNNKSSIKKNSKTDKIFQEGNEALKNQDKNQLEKSVRKLYRELPANEEEKVKSRNILPGLKEV